MSCFSCELCWSLATLVNILFTCSNWKQQKLSTSSVLCLWNVNVMSRSLLRNPNPLQDDPKRHKWASVKHNIDKSRICEAEMANSICDPPCSLKITTWRVCNFESSMLVALSVSIISTTFEVCMSTGVLDFVPVPHEVWWDWPLTFFPHMVLMISCVVGNISTKYDLSMTFCS